MPLASATTANEQPLVLSPETTRLGESLSKDSGPPLEVIFQPMILLKSLQW